MKHLLIFLLLSPFVCFSQDTKVETKTDITVVCLLVKDYDESINFYTNKLGFIVSMDRKFGGNQRWVSLKLPSSSLELSLGLADNEDSNMLGKQGGKFPFFVIATSDFDITYNKLLSNGVEFIDKPKKNPWGTTVTMKDLYGNQILLKGN